MSALKFTPLHCPLVHRGSLAVASALAVALSAGAAMAAPTDADLVTQFNLITSGNASTSSDIVGSMLVGGSISGGGTFDQSGAAPGGSVSSTNAGFGGINAYGSTASNAGNTASGVTVNLAASSYSGFGNARAVNTNVAFPYTFTSIWSQLTQLSSALGGLSTTPSTTLTLQQNTPSISATPTTVNGTSGVAVLDITGTQWNTLNGEGGQLSMNLGSTELLVINVDCNVGSCGGTGSTNYNGASTYGSDVLWNFISSSTFTMNFGVEFAGSILAVNGAINNNAGDIDGNVIASSYSASAELHDADALTTPGLLNTFTNGVTGNSTPVPEPSSFALLGAGLLGFALIRRRARQG